MIVPQNFPGDREYTLEALKEELALMERHLRDGSWHLCSCNPEKHLPLLAGLSSEGFGFAEDPEEREFMRQIRDRARVWRAKIQEGKFNDRDADQLRAWARELRHRIEFRKWSGPLEETPEFKEVVEEINALSGGLLKIEERHVDEILTHLSKKWGISKPPVRFVDRCNPLTDAWQVGHDLVVKDEDGETTRVALPQFDELVFCRGSASPYTISHEFCVPGWTLIRTPEQFKEITEIVEGSEIIGHSGQRRRVRRTMSRKHTGRMYSFKVMGYPDPIVVTEDHPLLVVKRPSKGGSSGRLKTLKDCGDPVWVKPDELSLQDYLVSPISCEIKDDEKVSEDLMRLTGYYLAEGCSGKYGQGYITSLAFSPDEHDFVKDVAQLFSTLFGAKPNIQDKGNHITVTISSKRAVEYFKQFGRGALNKYIPEWIMLLPTKKQEQLVLGYWRGDGSLQNKPRCRHYSIATRSRQLAWQVTELLKRMKYTPSLTSCWHKSSFTPGLQYQIFIQGPDLERFSRLAGDDQTFPRNRTWSLIKNDGQKTYHPIKSIKIEYVKDFPVWNLEVEEDNSYTANGIIVHNCHHLQRVKEGSTDEEYATKCGLNEVGNTLHKIEHKLTVAPVEQSLNTLSLKGNSGGKMAKEELMDYAPLVAGVFAGELIDEMGYIEQFTGGIATGFEGVLKAVIGVGAIYLGYTRATGAAKDFVIGLGAPLVVSGLKQQFMPAPTLRRPALTVPGRLTPYARPTGMYRGHPTLQVPMIPPRPGILTPPQMTAYGGMQEPALGGKWMLGGPSR